MSESDFKVRRPRHAVHATDQVAVWVTSQDEDPSWHAPARLVDVSRHGCRLFAACELPPDNKIRLVMDMPEAERQTEAWAEVRWQQTGTNGMREYGLEFIPELEWEFLGELFLSGTLESH